MLKAVHLKSFSSKSIKMKIFILQVDNKIADTAEVTEEKKIKYRMSLLKSSAVKWAANYVMNTEEDTFQTYINFKVQFL